VPPNPNNSKNPVSALLPPESRSRSVPEAIALCPHRNPVSAPSPKGRSPASNLAQKARHLFSTKQTQFGEHYQFLAKVLFWFQFTSNGD